MRLNDGRRMDYCRTNEYHCTFPECSCALSHEPETPPVQKSTNSKPSKEDYERVTKELRLIHNALSNMLERNRKAIHQNMKEISPGLWIHYDFKDLNEALSWLRSLLPTNT